MLKIDFVMSTDEAQSRCLFKGFAACGIQLRNQSFSIQCHITPPNSTSPLPGRPHHSHETRKARYAATQTIPAVRYPRRRQGGIRALPHAEAHSQFQTGEYFPGTNES